MRRYIALPTLGVALGQQSATLPFKFAEGLSPVAVQLRLELLRAIVSLELKPSSRISENDIAQRYGVSRQPVREAVIALAQTGLVKTMPQRGTVVVPISMRQMLDARFVREAVEVAVVRQAALAFSPSARLQLNSIIDQQEIAVASFDREAFVRYDEAFHRTLCTGIGSDTAWETVKNVKVHMDRVCTLTLRTAESMSPLIAEHKDILKVIDEHDQDGAERAMSRHLHGILSALPRLEASFPELFER